MRSFKVRELAQISAFAALMVLCSWITVPASVPFTMQTFAVFLAALLLGAKKGVVAVLVYIVLGILGLPVFSGGRAGISMLFGQTGGYIIGFLVCTFVCGKINEKTKKSPAAMMVSVLAGLLCVYIWGGWWFAFVYLSKDLAGFWSAFLSCTVPFIIPDIAKATLAVFVARRLSRHSNIFKC